MIYYIRIIIFFSLLYSVESQNFTIKFLGATAAKVNLEVQDVVFNDEKAKLISFSTNTINLTKYIFNVDNQYSTITSSDIKNILSFKKETYQPNLINKIQTHNYDNKTIYNNSLIEIPKNTFNIFSLLYFISKNKFLNQISFEIEREGLYYNLTIIPLNQPGISNIIEYKLNLELNDDSSKKPLIKHTDIFTWALFKKNSKKYITVDYKNNEIIDCVFDSGLIRMTAKNINYDK